MKWLKWLVGVLAAVLVLVIAVGLLGLESSDRNYMSHSAIDQARYLAIGCEMYYEHPKSGGKYPEKLADLIHPPFGDGPFVEDHSSDLIDPWGNPYKYALVQNENGKWEPYVWAERTVDGKTTLLGAKWTANGEAQLFGLPD